MCNRVLLLFWKLPQWNLHVNCHVNGMTFQSGLRFQTGLSSLRVSCKRALIQVFSCEFCGISRNTFSIEHLRETTSDIKFIYMENAVRLVLSAVLSWPPKIWFFRWFFIFLFMMTGRGIIFAALPYSGNKTLSLALGIKPKQQSWDPHTKKAENYSSVTG